MGLFVCHVCCLAITTRGDRIDRGDNEVCIPSKRILHSIFTFVVSQCEVSREGHTTEGHTTEDQGHLQSTKKSAGSVRPTYPVHFPHSLLYHSYLPSLPLPPLPPCIMLQAQLCLLSQPEIEARSWIVLSTVNKLSHTKTGGAAL